MPKAKPQPLKPTVSIIGAGRLGQALAIALNASGYNVKALVARRRAKAEKAARWLSSSGDSIQTLGANQLSMLMPTDLVLITTPDDAVEETAQKLAALSTRPAGTRVVLHTSGALSSSALTSLAQVGFHTGSLHPLVSVSDGRSGAKALRGAFYCVEGDAAATRIARKIVGDLAGKSFSIAPEAKALYHASALTAAGHLTALIDLAVEMLASCGLNRKTAQEVLMPLVESAVNNLKLSTPEKALTGTFARGDLATVRRHLKALSGMQQEEALKVYKLLGLRSLQMAGRKRIARELEDEIRKLLET